MTAPEPAAEPSPGATDEARVARQALELNLRELAAAFDAGADIDELLARRTRAVDEAVVAAWTRAFGNQVNLALVATGGYGRGELFPRSDVDLLILADEAVQEAQRAGIEAFFAGLWSLGIAPGHAVRSIAQCREAAREDVTVATALLEIRPLAGDPQAHGRLREAMATPGLWPPAAFYGAKRAEWNARHARYHDTAYNLEPNLKEGPGGLRDLHTLGWMAQRLYGVARLNELQALGALGADEFDILDTRRRSLSRLRFGLHLVAERREERLLFDYQKQLAARLGLTDEHRENLAVEQLMQDYFRSAALVLRIGERLLQRFAEGLAPDAPTTVLDADFVSIDGYLGLRDPELLFRRPVAILSLFRCWQQHADLRGLHSSTARALGEALSRIDERFRSEASVKASFLQLLREPQAIPTLERMARLGVLGRYLPAFGKVSGRMQYDLFHVYTVDQHTPGGAAQHGQFRGVGRPSVSRWARTVAAVAQAGAAAAGRAVPRHRQGPRRRSFRTRRGRCARFLRATGCIGGRHRPRRVAGSPASAMSVTAQRQDISDPEVVKRIASPSWWRSASVSTTSTC
jgi:[protein-PII] uridylyltransferase